jgi:hypothetical protein
MAITRDDRIGTGGKRAFEDSVVCVVLAHEVHRLGGMDDDSEAAQLAASLLGSAARTSRTYASRRP